MDPFEALTKLPEMIARYEAVTAELIAAKKELANLQTDKYVTYEWVCDYLGVSKPTAFQMLENEKLFVYGRQVKRFRRSEIIRFAERHSIKMKDMVALEGNKSGQ